MRLPFLDRHDELSRLRKTLRRREGTLAILYGRRRCGKSRLLSEVLPRQAVYYVGDDREGSLQRAGLATEVARLLPGFARVTYPDWAALFDRFWEQAPPGTVLALDEFPALVFMAREIPSLLQKRLDHPAHRRLHLVLTGSSQRMMQGLMLDRSAPLYGRAAEILKIMPLQAGWIQKALHLRDATQAIEAYAVWGGIPRYWELAGEHPDLRTAISDLVLSPLGVLHDEPAGLLLDDLRDTAQAASILTLIGQGCHRLSEIAARLQKPATSLSRPLQRLTGLDLVRRDVPFGMHPRDAKRTLYHIADPFLRFWFRYVEPNRSRLEAQRVASVAAEVARSFNGHVGAVWEELARDSVPWLHCADREWKPARRWWGPGLDRRPLEIDVVAESEDGQALLVGEAKWSEATAGRALVQALRHKVERFPHIGARQVVLGLWLKAGPSRIDDVSVFTPGAVLRALR
jgi:hypothetical protein